jgi:hypothetical protein
VTDPDNAYKLLEAADKDLANVAKNANNRLYNWGDYLNYKFNPFSNYKQKAPYTLKDLSSVQSSPSAILAALPETARNFAGLTHDDMAVQYTQYTAPFPRQPLPQQLQILAKPAHNYRRKKRSGRRYRTYA